MADQEGGTSMDDVWNVAQMLFSCYCTYVVAAWVWRQCCCCPCCCRRRQATAAADGGGADAAALPAEPPKALFEGQEVPLEQLKKRKELCTAYSLLLSTGLLGFHHFYLERFVHGLFCMWTLNFFCIGWLFDVLLLPVYVRGANASVCPLAPRDGSCRRVCTRLPVASVLLACVLSVLIVGTPPALQAAHILDMETLAAKTEANPYTILGVPRNCSKAEADAAAARKIQTVTLGSPRCDKACKQRLAELKRAQKFASGRAWREAEKPEKGSKAEKRQKERGPQEPLVFPAGGVIDLAFYSTHLWTAAFHALYDGVAGTISDIQENGFQKVAAEFVKKHFPRFYAWANSTRAEKTPTSPEPWDDEL